MEKTSLTVCKKPAASCNEASVAAREILRDFAFFIGETSGKRMIPKPELFEIWATALSDLRPEQIRAARDQLMKTWRFPNLPMPGDIRAQIDNAGNKASELEAEGEWHKLLAWVRRNYFPDVGVRRNAPSLSEDPEHAAMIEHAARAAGGYRYIESCSHDQLIWAKKAFLTALRNVRETKRAEHLLEDGEAKKILQKLTRGASAKLLVAPTPQPAPAPPTRDEVRTVLNRVSKSTPDEIAARVQRLQQKTAQINAASIAAVREFERKHGLTPGEKPISNSANVCGAVSNVASLKLEPNDSSATEARA